jgi:hypothetical protein
MPVCERDPWRLQYFENVPCPDDVLIPTDDPDSWNWYPRHRWLYDKLKVAESQGLACGPHGVMPERFPVFSKPMMNLKGMGIGSRAIASAAEFDHHYQPGHMWMEQLDGAHVSTDCAVVRGKIAWLRHATGIPLPGGMFKYWIVHAALQPALDSYLAAWVARHMADYTGMLNFESIGGRIIEAHLRFADQWPDLYGAGWVEALVRLYQHGRWDYPDTDRRDGYSVVLFGPHGPRYRHPPQSLIDKVSAMPAVSSVQITFHADKAPDQHAMPPGGFRLAIVNCFDLSVGESARERLRAHFLGNP